MSIPKYELTQMARNMRIYSSSMLGFEDYQTDSGYHTVMTLVYEDKVYIQYWCNGQCESIFGPLELTEETRLIYSRSSADES